MSINVSLSFTAAGIVFGITGLDDLIADLIVDFIGRGQSSGPLAMSNQGQVLLVYVMRFPFMRPYVCVTRLQTHTLANTYPCITLQPWK